MGNLSFALTVMLVVFAFIMSAKLNERLDRIESAIEQITETQYDQ